MTWHAWQSRVRPLPICPAVLLPLRLQALGMLAVLPFPLLVCLLRQSWAGIPPTLPHPTLPPAAGAAGAPANFPLSSYDDAELAAVALRSLSRDWAGLRACGSSRGGIRELLLQPPPRQQQRELLVEEKAAAAAGAGRMEVDADDVEDQEELLAAPCQHTLCPLSPGLAAAVAAAAKPLPACLPPPSTPLFEQHAAAAASMPAEPLVPSWVQPAAADRFLPQAPAPTAAVEPAAPTAVSVPAVAASAAAQAVHSNGAPSPLAVVAAPDAAQLPAEEVLAAPAGDEAVAAAAAASTAQTITAAAAAAQPGEPLQGIVAQNRGCGSNRGLSAVSACVREWRALREGSI
jgi:hypothetical protein